MDLTRNSACVLLLVLLFGGPAMAAEYYGQVTKLSRLVPEKALAASASLLKKPKCLADGWCRCETLKARAAAASNAADDVILKESVKGFSEGHCHLERVQLDAAAVSRLMKSNESELALMLAKADFLIAPGESHYYLSLLREAGKAEEASLVAGFVTDVVAPVGTFATAFMQRMNGTPTTPEDFDRYAKIYESAAGYFTRAGDAARTGKCKKSMEYCEPYFLGISNEYLKLAATYHESAVRLRQRAADAARNAETYSAIGGFFGALVGVGGDYGQVANLGAQVSNAIASGAQANASDLASMQDAISEDEFQSLLSVLR